MISVVMTAFQRARLLSRTLDSIENQNVPEPLEVIVVEDGDDGGETRTVCRAHPHLVAYFQRKDRPELEYSNPAVPINIGLRAARGNVIVLQNAECVHNDRNTIEKMVITVRGHQRSVAFAQVAALDPNGNFMAWYCHARYRPVPYFFCGAATRECFYSLRGMEESFDQYGYDDDLFGWYLTMNGYRYVFTDALVNHQWHKQTGCPGLASNRQHFEDLIKEVTCGASPVSNRSQSDWDL